MFERDKQLLVDAFLEEFYAALSAWQSLGKEQQVLQLETWKNRAAKLWMMLGRTPQFQVGQKVWTLWKNWFGTVYGGAIENVNSDFTYSVLYRDGGRDFSCVEERIFSADVISPVLEHRRDTQKFSTKLRHLITSRQTICWGASIEWQVEPVVFAAALLQIKNVVSSLFNSDMNYSLSHKAGRANPARLVDLLMYLVPLPSLAKQVSPLLVPRSSSPHSWSVEDNRGLFLPAALLTSVLFEYLSTATLCAISATNKNLHRLTQHPRHWSWQFASNYPFLFYRSLLQQDTSRTFLVFHRNADYIYHPETNRNVSNTSDVFLKPFSVDPFVTDVSRSL